MNVAKIAVHTDIFVEHLCGDRRPSVLRQAMGKFFCYTTVFTAIELFSFARNDREFAMVEDAMSAMKVLGLNPRGARRYGKLWAAARKTERVHVLIGGLCVESRLPILTRQRQDFAGIRGLAIVSPRMVERFETGIEALTALKQRQTS